MPPRDPVAAAVAEVEPALRVQTRGDGGFAGPREVPASGQNQLPVVCQLGRVEPVVAVPECEDAAQAAVSPGGIRRAVGRAQADRERVDVAAAAVESDQHDPVTRPVEHDVLDDGLALNARPSAVGTPSGHHPHSVGGEGRVELTRGRVARDERVHLVIHRRMPSDHDPPGLLRDRGQLRAAGARHGVGEEPVIRPPGVQVAILPDRRHERLAHASLDHRAGDQDLEPRSDGIAALQDAATPCVRAGGDDALAAGSERCVQTLGVVPRHRDASAGGGSEGSPGHPHPT